MSRRVPWDEIATPEGDYNVRLIPGERATPCFWGKDVDGRNLFVIELEGHHSQQFSKDKPVLNGISVDLRQAENPGKERLVLALEKHLDADLFLGLCETLLESLSPVENSSAALAVSFNHLKRWKAFLAGRNARLLSAEEIRGLFAELLLLRTLYGQVLTTRGAVEAWSGPERVQQDFVFADRALEVKSVSGKDRSTVRITSEDQLETVTAHLFLVTFRLTDTGGDEPGISLNALVKLVEEELDEAEAIEQFAGKLASLGYAPLPDYDTPTFVNSATQAYEVLEGFPRLVRSSLPAGIARVSYQIELETIAPYECAIGVALGV
jgi:hypothetical protein